LFPGSLPAWAGLFRAEGSATAAHRRPCRTPALERDALENDGGERIFVETVSGAGAARPVLEECLADLAAGDSLVVWRQDRLGRSAQHLLGILARLRERGVAFRSVTEGMDT